MARSLPEAEWKEFRVLHKDLLQRHCRETLHHLAEIAAAGECDPHAQYLSAFKYIRRRDKEIATAFDDKRRSTALRQLAIMRGMGILLDDDLARFSEKTQAVIRGITES